MARRLEFIFISLFSLPVFLWINNPVLEAGLDEETIKLIVGETKIISTRLPTRVVIGNPKIADIGDVTNSEITVSAKSPGVTKLVYWDAFGEQSLNIRVLQEDTSEIKRRVDNLLDKLKLGEVYTKEEEDEGRVMLLGRVKNPQDKERINIALGPLKDKTLDLIELKEEEAVIEIDVQILELNKGATSTLGLTWPGAINIAEKGSPGLSGAKWSTLFQALNFQRATVSSGTYTIDPFTFKLDALVQEGKARVLSRPRLACQSGKEAQLLVGGEKPIFTTAVQTTIGTSTSVQYKEFGIKLKINPTVSGENRIKLALNVEVSDVGEAEIIGATTAPTAKAYPLAKRSVSTELYLANGQTLAIGGLIKQKTEEDLRKLPWLADVPVLGMFFRQRVTKTGKGSSTKDDTELFITLTPTIVSKEISDTQVASLGKITPGEIASLEVAEIPSNLVNYVKAVQTKIVNAIYYPRQAKEAGWEGNVKLSLNITSNGDLREIKIAQSSGYKIIDDAAQEVASKQAPYPPFPPQIDSSELWVEVPIQYKKN